MGRDWLSDTTTVTLKSNGEIQAWCDRVQEQDRKRKEARAREKRVLAEWADEVNASYGALQNQYAALEGEFEAVARMYNHAELVMHRDGHVEDHYEVTLAYLERDLYDEAKAAKRAVLGKWGPLDAHAATWTGHSKEGRGVRVRRAVDTARVDMHSSEVAYWTAKIEHLEAFELNAANKAKVLKAQRARTQSRNEFWSAHRSMVEAGGDIANILDKTRRPASEEHLAELKESFFDRVDAWEAEQRQCSEALVASMVSRVIRTVRLRIADEAIESVESKLAEAKRERKVKLAELDKALEALQPPPPSSPAPAPAPVVVDPKVKALEAVRKLNREKALKTETLLAQRKRAVKAIEAEEKLAEAAAARASAAKGRGSRGSP